MGKHIANTATSYRFIGALGVFGLIAALAIGQVVTVPHTTLRGINVLVTGSLTPSPAGQPPPLNTFAAFGLPVMPAQPVINGFTNPFTGVTQPAVLFQGTIISNGTGTGGSTTGGGGSISGGGSSVSGGGGGGSSVSGGTSGGNGGFTVLPSISALPGGGNSLSGGANSGGVVGSVSGGGVTGASGGSGISGNTGVSGAIGTTGGGGGAITGGGGGGATGGKGSFSGGYGI
jgi:hypothetical protein